MAGMFRNYIRFPNGSIVECEDVIAFAQWFETADRKIDLTAVPYGDGDKQAVLVSTVFLGMDHSFSNDGEPVLFETLASMPDGGEFGQRYCTEDEARAGHKAIVAQVQEALIKNPEIDKAINEVLDLPADDELTDGLKAVVHTPQPVPPPKPQKIKDPPRKAADPKCRECAGEGEHVNDFGMIVMCECTIVRRK